MRLTNLAVPDFRDLGNALSGGPGVPATVSFDIRWGGTAKRLQLRNSDQGFAGQFIENSATVAWSANQAGFRFISDPANTTTNVFSVIGRERNGVFLPKAGLSDIAQVASDAAADALGKLTP